MTPGSRVMYWEDPATVSLIAKPKSCLRVFMEVNVCVCLDSQVLVDSSCV